ncbi:MAG TPA: bifunctional diguanylate cyclase/phosphodiesterase [Chromatiales bacterium]|jgi:diguanylate cyclase (GGDEF)-like protein|nr:bifunctional diguanylate cyclase/phosphodiesterase [Chromatiales bacterium]HIO14544.1 bifunctional diguanylate cyclase/phosphodiesterase [Chromatiales bacterium]HIO54065.1 bifunctional diguanylate cyclase/phosphodiesterase [Chromatiales bacterium]
MTSIFKQRGWQVFMVFLLLFAVLLIAEGNLRYQAFVEQEEQRAEAMRGLPGDGSEIDLAMPDRRYLVTKLRSIVLENAAIFFIVMVIGGVPMWLQRRDLWSAHKHIDSLNKSNASLQHTSLHDPLTGNANRILLAERLEQAILNGQRTGELFALLVIDLNRFKAVNDALGHAVGDELLRQLGVRLKLLLRETDTVARMGGDEFAILARIETSGQVDSVLAKVFDQFDAPFEIGISTLNISAHIGVAMFPQHGRDAATLLERADAAMYVAKKSRVSFSIYDAVDAQKRPDRLALLGRLREAIAQDELELWYQPKVNIEDRSVYGVEALVRWNHPTHGIIFPDEFLPLAEQSSVIQLLTIHVLEQALRFLALLLRRGYRIKLAVNLSARILEDPEFPVDVVALLQDWDLPPELLQFEITENLELATNADPLAVLRRLRSIGVGLSIDDFGVGYSSLFYLKNLPVNELKLDKSFAMNMVGDERDAAIIRSSIELAHSLGLSVVAEGVESQQAMDMLASYGCDIAQGTLIAAALTEDELLNWLDGR